MTLLALRGLRVTCVAVAAVLAVQFLQPQITSAQPIISLSKTVCTTGSGSTCGTSVTTTPGMTLQYVVSWGNSGASGTITITDALAAGQTYLPGTCAVSAPSGSVATCSYNSGSNTLTATIVPAPTASSGFMTFNTQVNSGFNGAIPNQATGSASGATTVTSNTTTVVVNGGGGGGGNLTVTKQLSRNGGPYTASTTAVPGDSITYLITTTANVALAGATLTDQIFGGQVVTSLSTNCTLNTSSNIVTCSLGNMAPGTVASTFITVTIPSSAAGGTLPNSATVSTSNAGGASSNVTQVAVTGSPFPTPTPTPGPFFGQVIACGPVTNYSASSSVGPGFITINGTTYPIAPGVVPISPFTFVIGNNICLFMQFNGAGQITAAQGTSNVTGMNLVCGVYQPSGLAGSINVGGFNYGLAAGFFFPFTLVPGQFYCFLQAPGGAIVQALSTIPTSIRAPEMHETWTRVGRMLAG